MNDKLSEGLIAASKQKHKPLIPGKPKKRRYPWRGRKKSLSDMVIESYDRVAYEALMADINVFTSWYLK